MTNGHVAYTVLMHLTDDLYHELGSIGWHEVSQCFLIVHHQNDAEFKTQKLLIYGIFYLVFSEHGRRWASETTRNDIMDKAGDTIVYKKSE